MGPDLVHVLGRSGMAGAGTAERLDDLAGPILNGAMAEFVPPTH
jgi:hypothetical protein